jgi:hypothetical protein
MNPSLLLAGFVLLAIPFNGIAGFGALNKVIEAHYFDERAKLHQFPG